MFRIHDQRDESSSAFASSTTDAPHAPQIHSHLSGCYLWTWDGPQRWLSISRPEGEQWMTAATLPLRSLKGFLSAVRQLDRGQLDMLDRALTDARRELELWREVPPWPDALYEAIGLLLMYLLACEPADRGTRARVNAAARGVIDVLPAESVCGAWRVAYQSKLTSASRAGVLAAAVESRELEHAELLWWTARCRFEHAVRWRRSEGVETVESVRELTEAATSYIRLLQAGQARRAMEAFYESMGTTSEDEILRALGCREELAICEDTLRTEITTWLLRRYSLFKACRLLRGTLSRSELVGGWIALFVCEAALFLFLMQTMPRVQVGVQLAAFVALVLFAPRIFALFLPRALFGTLLAWLTVVLAQAASLLPIVSADRDEPLHQACHLWLRNIIHPAADIRNSAIELARGRVVPPALFEFIGIIAAASVISIIFLKVEVHSRLATSSGARSALCFLVMLIGSLFWGAMLVPSLQYIVSREPIGTICACIFPAWLLGSVCAVAFGILVQLMWDDHAVGDSLGLPSEAGARK